MSRRVNKRIPVSDTTMNRLRAFADGLGTTYDEAINFLVDLAAENGENPKLAGHRLRGQFDPLFSEDQESDHAGIR